MANLDAIYRVIHQPSGHVVDDYNNEASALACAERENEEYPDSHVVVKYVRADQAPPAAVPANVRERWNIERDGDALRVCFNNHEKGEACEYVRYVPEAPLAAVPAGYVLVPVEPTTAMKCRAVEAWEGPAAYKSIFARGLADLEDKAAECWDAMLAATREGEP